MFQYLVVQRAIVDLCHVVVKVTDKIMCVKSYLLVSISFKLVSPSADRLPNSMTKNVMRYFMS